MEATFKQQFVANFLSSWCALNFHDYCSRGLHTQLESPPVDDAIHLADCAWQKLQAARKSLITMYGIGQVTGPGNFGMWYGPDTDLQKLLTQSGLDDLSVIVTLPGDGTEGAVLYRWDLSLGWQPALVSAGS